MANTAVRVSTHSGSRSILWGIAAAVGLGCLWGIAEITLGTRLHLSQVPLAGQMMIPIGIFCALSAYRLCPMRGIVISAGVAAASMRLFATGPLLVMPAFAILLEAMLMEGGLLLLGPRRAGFAAAGAAAALYPLLHAFVLKTLLFGLPLATVYAGMIKQARGTFSIAAASGLTVLALWTLACVVIGAAAGFAIGAIPSRKRPA